MTVTDPLGKVLEVLYVLVPLERDREADGGGVGVGVGGGVELLEVELPLSVGGRVGPHDVPKSVAVGDVVVSGSVTGTAILVVLVPPACFFQRAADATEDEWTDLGWC